MGADKGHGNVHIVNKQGAGSLTYTLDPTSPPNLRMGITNTIGGKWPPQLGLPLPAQGQQRVTKAAPNALGPCIIQVKAYPTRLHRPLPPRLRTCEKMPRQVGHLPHERGKLLKWRWPRPALLTAGLKWAFFYTLWGITP